jgi:hypothetical protein
MEIDLDYLEEKLKSLRVETSMILSLTSEEDKTDPKVLSEKMQESIKIVGKVELIGEMIKDISQ